MTITGCYRRSTGRPFTPEMEGGADPGRSSKLLLACCRGSSNVPQVKHPQLVISEAAREDRLPTQTLNPSFDDHSRLAMCPLRAPHTPAALLSLPPALGRREFGERSMTIATRAKLGRHTRF